jgi:phosphate transport system substrate-binding protein
MVQVLVRLSKFVLTILIVLTSAFVAAASSSHATPLYPPISLPPVYPSDLDGDLAISGSLTVHPLSAAIGEQFLDDGFPGSISFDFAGSDAGLQNLCDTPGIDIASTSRPMSAGELALCHSHGVRPVEMRMSVSALVFAVANPPGGPVVTGLTLSELALAFTTAANWTDVRSGLPSQPIHRYLPESSSDAFLYFVAAVIQPHYASFDEARSAVLNASNVSSSDFDSVIKTSIENDPVGIGFTDNYLFLNPTGLALLSIDGIPMNGTNVGDESYPISRGLYLYGSERAMYTKPEVAGFLNYYLTHVDEKIDIVGYFSLETDDLNVAKIAWLVAMGPRLYLPIMAR